MAAVDIISQIHNYMGLTGVTGEEHSALFDTIQKIQKAEREGRHTTVLEDDEVKGLFNAFDRIEDRTLSSTNFEYSPEGGGAWDMLEPGDEEYEVLIRGARTRLRRLEALKSGDPDQMGEAFPDFRSASSSLERHYRRPGRD